MPQGTVRWLDPERRFGFLAPEDGDADLFVHVSVLGVAEPLQKGERDRYKVRQSDRGAPADHGERV